MNSKDINSFIAQLRKEQGITQRELAEQLHVSDKTISHWERGDSSPDLSIVPQLADIFGITCDELLRGERNEHFSAPEQAEPAIETDNKALISKLQEKYKKFGLQCQISGFGIFIGTVLGLFAGLFSRSIIFGVVVFAFFMIASFIALMLIYSVFIFSLKTEPNLSKKRKARFLWAANYTTLGNYLYMFALVLLSLAFLIVLFKIEDAVFNPYLKGGMFLSIVGATFVLVRSFNLNQEERFQKKHILLGVILTAVILVFSISTAVFQTQYYNGDIDIVDEIVLRDADEVKKIMDEEHNVLFNDRSDSCYYVYDENADEKSYDWKNEFVTYCYVDFEEDDSAIYYIGIQTENIPVAIVDVFDFLYNTGFFVYSVVFVFAFIVQTAYFKAIDKKKKQKSEK